MPPPAASRLRLAPGLGAAEVHAHTLASDGVVTPEALVEAAAKAGITVLAVTDHDTIASCERAAAAGAECGVDVVRGEEVTTRAPASVHVVALFLTEPIRMGMTIEDTVDAIHDQGGLAILAHPFMPTFFASIQEGRARRLLETHAVDGVELRHTAPIHGAAVRRLDRFYATNRERLGAALGAGDSHFGRFDLGRMVTAFPGRGAADLRAAIEARTTSPLRGIDPAGPPLSLRLAQQRRSLLWLPNQRRIGAVGGGRGPRVSAQTPSA